MGSVLAKAGGGDSCVLLLAKNDVKQHIILGMFSHSLAAIIYKSSRSRRGFQKVSQNILKCQCEFVISTK